MKDRQEIRGYYKPSSYRFSDKSKVEFKKLAIKLGSQEKAMKYLLELK